MTRYTFGDDARAEHRLGLLAGLYASTSASCLRSAMIHTDRVVDVAIDIGCGPGHTTRLVSDVSSARETVGLDASTGFIASARRRYAELAFAVHDVTKGPFPCPRADLGYCRFVLTHLSDPATALRTWSSQLRPGGVLVLEEVSHLTSVHPAFSAYYELVTELQRTNGQDLTIGARLGTLATEAGFTVIDIDNLSLEPPAHLMAELHVLNLGHFRHDPQVAQLRGAGWLEDLERNLRDATNAGSAHPSVEQHLCRVVARAAPRDSHYAS